MRLIRNSLPGIGPTTMTELPTSPPPDTPPDARHRVLEAAEAEFAEKGYEAATVRDICRRAGANVAAVNYYFRDKDTLYRETLRVAHECADGEGPGQPAFEWPADLAPVDKLGAFIRHMAMRMHAPARPTALQLLMREFAHPSPAAQEVILRYIRPKAFALRGILEEMFPGTDPRRLLMVGFSVIGQILFYRQNRPVVELIFGKDHVDALDAEMVADHVTRFTLAALGHGEPVTSRKVVKSSCQDG